MSLSDVLTRDAYELQEVYEKRVALTNSLYEKYHLNPVTSMVMGRMFINKMLMGVKYDEEIEQILDNINV